MPRVRLTQDYISHHLHCADGKKTRIEFVDDQVQNFFVEVRRTSPGQGTYYLRYRSHGGIGTTKYARIGKTTDISLTDARKKALELKAEILANGADPRGEINAKKAMPTLSQFYEDHVLGHLKCHTRSWKTTDQRFRLRLAPTFGHLPLDAIQKSSVMRFHQDLLVNEKASGATADHYVKVLARCLSLGIDFGYLKSNPLAKFKYFKFDNRNTRFLSESELQTLLTALRAEKSQTVPLLAIFLLATGARLGEAIRARWSEISRENRQWFIPSSNAKSKRGRYVPLNSEALAVLDRLGTEGKHEFCWTNPKTGQRIKSVHKRWDYLRKKIPGMETLRLHMLRHTHASHLARGNVSLFIIQQLLGHTTPAMTMRYSHLSGDVLATASAVASNTITNAMKAKAA